ncbi:putative quinol monooxygenase [Inconstantimicrobium mannanitabidum]|uniref:Antibiotic biosynthesis monooxygenase n=1 Tax=Inconstantimicrobium mannanitabidum TaxID=1604901 RepID=A0ACB5RD69_9CLOT|nr:putative quinol monooxygenase [Clostridium sp. TW13]GKX67215.1 antibiotic biosynthesis monooxygenase [Clostridium sp. TW13]
MIKVVAKHFVKEDKINIFLESAKKLVEATRKETGCIKYELHQDIKDPKILTMIEEWEDNQSLDNHMASKHFREIVPMLGTLMEKEAEMNLYKKVI